jgi:hypothetical protein
LWSEIQKQEAGYGFFLFCWQKMKAILIFDRTRVAHSTMMNPIAIRYATFAGHFKDGITDSLKRDGPVPSRENEPVPYGFCGNKDRREGVWLNGVACAPSGYNLLLAFGIHYYIPNTIHDEIVVCKDFQWDRLSADERAAKLGVFIKLRSSILDMKDVTYIVTTKVRSKSPSGFNIIIRVAVRSMYMSVFITTTEPIKTDPHGGDMFLHALAAIKYALQVDPGGIPMQGEITHHQVMALTEELSFIPEINMDLEARSKRGCVVCGATRRTGKNPKNGKLYHCECSTSARYCGIDCQRVHWLWGHREVCPCNSK